MRGLLPSLRGRPRPRFVERGVVVVASPASANRDRSSASGEVKDLINARGDAASRALLSSFLRWSAVNTGCGTRLAQPHLAGRTA